MEKEVWKPIEGYEGIYDVSNLGRIRAYPRVGSQTSKIRLMTLATDKDGYKRVSLSNNSKKRRFSVHRLVAKAFIPNPEGKPQVNHKNGRKDQNNIENLEWVTQSENTKHSFRVLAQPPNKTNCRKVRCVELNRVFSSIVEASEATGAGRSEIGKVARHSPRYKTAGGYQWEYVDDEEKESEKNKEKAP